MRGERFKVDHRGDVYVNQAAEINGGGGDDNNI